jgi:hypothetical protein
VSTEEGGGELRRSRMRRAVFPNLARCDDKYR